MKLRRYLLDTNILSHLVKEPTGIVASGRLGKED
jgi:predicted nucleic acid-binding protein